MAKRIVAVLTTVLTLAAWSGVASNASEAKKSTKTTVKKPSFKRVVYTTADERQSIIMISSSELEIANRDGNTVCKYTKENGVIRAVMTGFGGSQAVYYNIVAGGLQDKNGVMFYSPTALAQVKSVAESAADVKARSKVATRLLMEMQASKWGHGDSEVFSIKLTDVAIKYSLPSVNYGIEFGDIYRLQLQECTTQMNPCELRIYYTFPLTTRTTNTSFYFKDDKGRREFAKAADEAVQLWKATFSNVLQRNYSGVVEEN